ncbi:unnamed protein product [Owenia fusiformis]|uniref:Uncharacterized protein n=1 Tax=Owenia fusiformis TaxID=6347 RepID=A0A8J1Y2I1_OWEFU|nr:unnamed protein product [Owenia fusiformis]
MSLEDPFFVVKEEVQKALQTAKTLYQRWSEIVDDKSGMSKEELDWTANELRNSLRSIEWDLEDLDETIGIVEKNPKKFKIDQMELRERKAFVHRTKISVKDMKDDLANPKRRIREDKNTKTALLQNGPSRPQDKYTRLDNDISNSNSRFIEDTQQQQQMLIRSQDDQIDQMGASVTVLKNVSHHIGNELDDQALMLDDFSHEMDNTDSRMDSVMKKMAKVLHMSNDRRQWCAIGVLVVIMIIVILLFILL